MVLMITDADVTKLKKTFATKKEFNGLVARVDGIAEKVGDLSVEVGEINDKIDGLDVKFDAMIGLLSDSMQEHAVGAVQYARHDRQIKALAVATNTPLPD